MGERIVDLSDLEARIANEVYFTGDQAFHTVVVGPHHFAGGGHYTDPLKRITVCFLTLHNGFVAVGTSACASREVFDEGVGRRYAREDALRNLWAIEGYHLRQKLFEADPSDR